MEHAGEQDRCANLREGDGIGPQERADPPHRPLLPGLFKRLHHLQGPSGGGESRVHERDGGFVLLQREEWLSDHLGAVCREAVGCDIIISFSFIDNLPETKNSGSI